MALIAFGNGVSQIRGSIAGNTYSRNNNGAYIRNKAIPVNPNSVLQVAVRSAFAIVAVGWRALTAAQQDTWVQGAINFGYTNKLGERQYLTGSQCFNKLNGQLFQAGIAMIQECPVSVTVPTVILNSISGTLRMDISIDGATTVPANTTLVILATAAVSAGKYRPKAKDFRVIEYVPTATVDLDTYDVNASYRAIFGGAATGQKMYYAVFCVANLTGQKGNQPYLLSDAVA